MGFSLSFINKNKKKISAVSFDPYKCTDRSYRFGSVGEDAKLCLWDFTVSSLFNHQKAIKKHQQPNSARAQSLRKLSVGTKDEVVHEVLGKTQVAVLEPLMVNNYIDFFFF